MTDETAQFIGTGQVRDQHTFDVSKLETYLRAHLDGFEGPLEVEQFKGGQSCPTYKLSAGGKSYVLRRKPPGKLLPSAHAVDREYKVISALSQTDVPVPKTYLLCEDESIVGTIFYIMENVEGRVFWDQTLAEIPKSDRARYYDAMNQTLVALHSVDYAAVGLADFGKAGDYVARQINRWTKQYRISETETVPEMDRLIEWLPGTIPSHEVIAVVHGDYRLDNMIFHPTEPRVLAILDWEISTLGDALADFSYHLMSWRMGGENFRGLAGHDLAVLGIPSEADYAALYCQRMGWHEIAQLEWYMVYNMFRLSAILQGIAKRAIDGTASSDLAVEQGKRAKPMAQMAWALAQEKLL